MYYIGPRRGRALVYYAGRVLDRALYWGKKARSKGEKKKEDHRLYRLMSRHQTGRVPDVVT